MSDHFDRAVDPGGVGESSVGREQSCVEGFCERDVARVVRREILAEIPEPMQQTLRREHADREVEHVADRCCRLVDRQPSCVGMSAKDRGDFDAEEIGPGDRLAA